jgi:hypothetical protein
VFAAFGTLATPTAVTTGFRPALAVVAGLSLLGGLPALAVGTPRSLAISTEGEVGLSVTQI